MSRRCRKRYVAQSFCCHAPTNVTSKAKAIEKLNTMIRSLNDMEENINYICVQMDEMSHDNRTIIMARMISLKRLMSRESDRLSEELDNL